MSVEQPGSCVFSANMHNELCWLAVKYNKRYTGELPFPHISIRALITEHIYHNVSLTMLGHHHSNSSDGT